MIQLAAKVTQTIIVEFDHLEMIEYNSGSRNVLQNRRDIGWRHVDSGCFYLGPGPLETLEERN